MTIFAPYGHYEKKWRKELMPMLRPFFKDDGNLGEDERAASYGTWTRRVTVTDSARLADVAVLPMSWNYYVLHRKRAVVLDFVAEAKAAGLEVVTWSSGDLGVTPFVNGTVVFRSSGNRRGRLPRQFALPVFFSDPLQNFFQCEQPPLRDKESHPVIGFCGQAFAPAYKNLYDILRTTSRNVKYYMGLSPYEPQQLYPATLRRQKVLALLVDQPELKTSFLIRKSYRAGATTSAEKRKTSLEYYQNILDSDYTVCLRGNGNFSARLYETLAMGRTPIIVDTDCVYPWDHLLDWKTLGIFVAAKEIATLPEKILQHHASISPAEFQEAQLLRRATWEKFLSYPGFFSTLLDAWDKKEY